MSDADACVCDHCEEEHPAVCYGAYESEENVGFACGECCGHGNEDGWCVRLTQIPDLVFSRRELMQERNELRARVAALEEQLRIVEQAGYSHQEIDRPIANADSEDDDSD